MFTEYPWQFLFQLGLQKDSYTATESLNKIENFGQQAEKNNLKRSPIYSREQFYEVPKFLSFEINRIFQYRVLKSN